MAQERGVYDSNVILIELLPLCYITFVMREIRLTKYYTCFGLCYLHLL